VARIPTTRKIPESATARVNLWGQVATSTKELMVIKGASHIDLYDRMDKIPFDKMAEFFGKNLQG